MSDVVVKLTMDASQYDKTLRKAEKQMRSFKKSSYLAKSMVNEFRSQLMGFASVGASISVLGDSVNKIMEFEKSISSLSALTGIAGKDLDYFRQQAVLLGSTTTQTATQVADAFKLIGSQQPQLLESKEALVAVTRSAITLAEASETDVPTAAKALSGALNQMGAGAEYAEEYINILAAASQKGSADIGYLNSAVEKSGGTANAVGIKFNELVAAIETIAPKVTNASEAGTQLRNIFIKLESSTDKNLKPSVVGLGGAIDNLAKQHLTAGEMAKKFGVENVNAALALTKSKDTYHDLETAITGTNTATEQARINTDNLKGAITQLGSAWEGLILSFSKSDGVLKNVVNQVTKLVNATSWLLSSKESFNVKLTEGEASDAITRGYGFARKYEDKGMPRKDALNRAVADMEKELSQLEKRRKRDISDLEKLVNKQPKILEPINGKVEIDSNGNIKNQTGAGDLPYMSWLQTSDGRVIDTLQQQIEYTNRKIEGYQKAIVALKQQASGVVNLDIDDTIETGSGGTGSAGGTGGTGGTSSGRITPKSLAKVYPVGSLGAYQAELTKLNEELNSATTTESRQQIQAEIDSVQRLINAIKELNSVRLLEVDDRGKVVDPDMDLSYKAPTIEELTPLWGPREMMTDLKTDVWGAEEYLEEWRKATLDMDPKPIEEWGAAIDGVSAILSQSSNEWVRMASTALNVIGQIIQATATGGINAGGGFGLFGSLISLFGGAFADGGIVGGQRYNDGIVARVSSGEMIINQADQKRLFNSIRRGESGGGGMVRMTLRGEDLISAINNYGSRSGQGKIKFER